MRGARWLLPAAALGLLTGCGSTPRDIVLDPLPATSTTQRPGAAPTITPAATTATTASGGLGVPVTQVTSLPATTSTAVVAVEPPTIPGAPDTAPPDTTPATTEPATTEPATTTEAPPTTGATDPAGCVLGCGQIVPLPSLLEVPQLGEDPVQGNGCGLATPLGDQMPDGLWYGLVYPAATSLNLDVVCVYVGDAAVQRGAGADETGFYPENIGNRQRRIDLADDFTFRRAVAEPDGRCVDPGPAGDADWSSAASPTTAWIVVGNGAVTGVIAMCDGITPAPS